MTDNNREYILELFKIVSTTSILVIDNKGILKRLHCPFRICAIVELPPDIALGAFYMVDSLKMTLDLKEVFIIRNKAYFIYYFKIM